MTYETAPGAGRGGVAGGSPTAVGVLGGRRALVAGGSGLVGGQLLRLLLADPDYERVTVLVRRPLPFAHEKLVQRVIEFDRLETAGQEFAVDDVFCCLGTTIKQAGSQAAFRWVDQELPVNMGELAKAAGAPRFLIVTAMGADPHSHIFYNQVKGATEAALLALDLPALYIFRPALLLGQREEPRPGEAVAAVLCRVANPLLVGPLRRYRAIPAADVAKAMWLEAKRGASGARIYRSDEIAARAAGSTA